MKTLFSDDILVYFKE